MRLSSFWITRLVVYNQVMHIGVLTHNYPRFVGDFSGTFVEALCHEFATQGQQVTVWAPHDAAYTLPAHHRADTQVRLQLISLCLACVDAATWLYAFDAR